MLHNNHCGSMCNHFMLLHDAPDCCDRFIDGVRMMLAATKHASKWRLCIYYIYF